MDKEKAIKNEMVRIVFGEQWVNDAICLQDTKIKKLYNAGYRKADEVMKETIKTVFAELLTMFEVEANYKFNVPMTEVGFAGRRVKDYIMCVAFKHGVEVESE